MTIREFVTILKRLPHKAIIKNVSINESGMCEGNNYNYCLGETYNGGAEYVGEIISFLEQKVVGSIKWDIEYTYDSILVYGFPDCGGFDIEGILLTENGYSIKKYKSFSY